MMARLAAVGAILAAFAPALLLAQPRDREFAGKPRTALTKVNVSSTPAPRSRAAKPPAAAPALPFLDAVARQAALDRAGYSPGLIDGALGRKTTHALTRFQRARGLVASGQFDDATLAALRIAESPATLSYPVSAQDFQEIGPSPKDWNAKARLPRLGYESLATLLAERGHCTVITLARLNPGRKLESLRPGDTINLPNVQQPDALPAAAAIEVDLSDKTVSALDRRDNIVALFHCSIAKFAEKRPRGQTRIAKVARDPVYNFDPAMWPEVKNVARKLTIPPGPRNPVGLAWIGLELPGYGIHGTPAPEMIGKTGSHGCIRLANWDAVRLLGIVRPGTPVRFVD